jgi:hypothetical protein
MFLNKRQIFIFFRKEEKMNFDKMAKASGYDSEINIIMGFLLFLCFLFMLFLFQPKKKGKGLMLDGVYYPESSLTVQDYSASNKMDDITEVQKIDTSHDENEGYDIYADTATKRVVRDAIYDPLAPKADASGLTTTERGADREYIDIMIIILIAIAFAIAWLVKNG